MGAEQDKKNRPNAFKDLSDTTSRVVQQAASILEEEIAAGIRVAKDIEGRFLKVEELRARKPDEVVQRFRNDAHEVLDILMDLVQGAAKAAGDLTQRAVSVRTGERPATPRTSDLPTLTMPGPVGAGQSAETCLTVENDSDNATAEFSFRATDFLSPEGERIPAGQVSFAPELITMAPRSKESISIRVTVPEGTPAGVYSGLLQATRLQQLRSLLVIEVK